MPPLAQPSEPAFGPGSRSGCPGLLSCPFILHKSLENTCLTKWSCFSHTPGQGGGCIHSQDKVLLTVSPHTHTPWGVAPTQPGQGPRWLWEPADWQWIGLTGHLPAVDAARWSGPVLCQARGSHGSLGTEYPLLRCELKVRQVQGGHPAQNLLSRPTQKRLRLGRLGLNCHV